MIGLLLLLQSLPTTVVVSPDGAVRRIGDAVAMVATGGVVVVQPGTYREPTIRITRPLTLRGDPGSIIDGEGERELLVIAAPDVTVQGFTFRHTGVSDRDDRAGVRVLEVARCRVAHNRFEDTYFAIYVQGAAACVVEGNQIQGRIGGEARTGNGIHAWTATHLTVRGNVVSGHRDGVYLEFARHAVVDSNLSTGNRRYGLHFMYSDSSAYRANRFEANGTGVAVMYSRHVEMTRNRFADNRGPAAYGLLLKEIADGRLTDNLFANNTTALVADGAERLVATGNLFAHNGRAVRLLANSGAARFLANAFRGNSFDLVVNSRRSATTFTGNYWDAYRGWDLDRDGTGDVPHHPVRLFALMVERAPSAMLLERSLMVRLLDAAERALPALTPESLNDPEPRMRPPAEPAP